MSIAITNLDFPRNMQSDSSHIWYIFFGTLILSLTRHSCCKYSLHHKCNIVRWHSRLSVNTWWTWLLLMAPEEWIPHNAIETRMLRPSICTLVTPKHQTLSKAAVKTLMYMCVREKHWFVVPLIYAFIGLFLSVPWPGIEPTILAY